MSPLTQNGVTETATGDLIRAGFSDFLNDGSFDGATQTYRTDVPVPAKVRGGEDETMMHRSAGADGTLWTEVAQP